MKRPVFDSLIGAPLDRVDGPAKVTGKAVYAADHRGSRRAVIGTIVEAPIGRGGVTGLDTTAAQAADGVILVMTSANAPKQAPFGAPDGTGRFTQSHAVLGDDRVRHYGAPVALVVAETLEQSRHAARLVAAEYRAEEGVFDAEADESASFRPDSLDGSGSVDTDAGDFDAAFAEVRVRLEAEFYTPAQHAAAMEPHATVAEWNDGRLTVHLSLQILSSARAAFANTLGIDPGGVRILSPFIGGGFGSKLGIHDEAVLAALAARLLDRPVRIVQTRRNLFACGPHRSRHRQRIRLGATGEGRLVAVEHDVLAGMARDYPFCEADASPTRASYAATAIRTRHRVVEADIPKVDSMRAPGEAVGTLVLEAAIDELAEKCGVDPLEFRLANEPDRDPTTGKPFSTRRLAECLREGARRFGWQQGWRRPGSAREGNLLIGRGMAAAVRPNFLQKADAAAALDRDGRLTVQLDMTDIGTGSYTILTQIAAETLGLDPAAVTVRLGDSTFPETCGSGGSFGAGSTGSAVLAACRKLKGDVLARAGRVDEAWRGANAEGLTIADGRCRVDGREMPLDRLFRAGEGDVLECLGHVEPGTAHDDLAQYSYGGQFAEVSVDADTGEIRVRRMVGVFDAGRILNEKTARSQLMGGMIFGIGAALMEESVMDDRYGVYINRDLAEYHIPVNRDVPRLDVTMLEGRDEDSNPLGSKGVGELGICGAGAAIANAVYDATGFRTRHFPIRVEDVLALLPDQR